MHKTYRKQATDQLLYALMAIGSNLYLMGCYIYDGISVVIYGVPFVLTLAATIYFVYQFNDDSRFISLAMVKAHFGLSIIFAFCCGIFAWYSPNQGWLIALTCYGLFHFLSKRSIVYKLMAIQAEADNQEQVYY